MADAPIRTTVNNLAAYLAKNLPGNISSTTLQGVLSTYVSLNSTASLPLTAVQPDYESNVAELQGLLNNSSNPAWNQTEPTATGQMFIGMTATAQAYNQFGIERAYQEAFSESAQLPSSIYRNARNLGVTVAQKQPAQTTVTLTLPNSLASSLTIAAYTQITIGNLNYYNRNQITFPAGTTQLSNITLYQGTPQTITYYSNGLPSQSFTLSSQDFEISQADIIVTVGGTQYTSTTKTTFYSVGLWEYNSTSQVYYQTTDASGNTQIVFGDGDYGVIPQVNSQIVFSYVTTLGAAGNVDNSNATFSINTILNGAALTLTGIVNTPNSHGQDQRLPQEYAIISPGTYSAKHRPSTVQDHNVFALGYPGVIDAKFRNQQNFAPYNLNFMMVMQVALLTSTAWTATDFQNFITWLQEYSIANMQFMQNTVSAIPVNITANVYCTDQIPLSTLENLIIANLQTLFTPQAGFLGYSIYKSDIESTILKSDPNGNIQYIQLVAPTADQIIDVTKYLTLGTVSLNMKVSNRNTLGLN